jgi:hypothetical protein
MLIGTINMPEVSVSGWVPKSGPIQVNNQTVNISDPAAMARFSAYMLRADNFSWRLSGSASAKALFLTINNLQIDKVVTLASFGGFKNVSINQFDLPTSDPVQGIVMKASSTMINPSTISLAGLGKLDFSVSYSNATVGSLSATDVSLVPGANPLNLNGFIKTDNLDILSQMFTAFVGGQSSPIKVVALKITPPNGEIDWLSKSFAGLELTLTLTPPSGKLQLVSGITVNLFIYKIYF